MDKRIDALTRVWEKRNIAGFYCADKEAAVKKVLELIPSGSSVGFSGSVTLEQLGLIGKLSERGNKIFNPYKAGISSEEKLELRRQGSGADFYLASANAVSEKGELVFFSAFGNRTSGVSYAKNAIIVCGINKLTRNVEEALKRAREYSTPLNCKRLNWQHGRMCCQILIIEAEVAAGRLKVILVGEELGF